MAFEQFITKRKRDLQRIASHTRGEYQVSDIQNEAWIISLDLQESKGIPIDFLNSRYQDLLLSHLYQRFVRYADHHVRYAIRFDHAPQNDGWQDESHWLMRTLVGDDGRHPLSELLEREATSGRDAEPDCHHSLAAAYVYLLRHFDNRMHDVADYLLISLSHGYRLCAHARMLAAHQQPIIFRSTIINNGFFPKTWRRFRLQRIPLQLAFDFGEEPFLWSE